MEDTTVDKGLREKLVQELIGKGISDQNVINAMRLVPRHFFYQDKGLKRHIYMDKALPIASGQTISQPYTVALQTQLLDVKKQEKILEIGTGSGYQTAILATLGARVYTIERQQTLYIQTKELLKNLHYFATTFLGDGFKGLPQYAPFDKIIITAAAPYISKNLLDQVRIGGRIVSPMINGERQEMVMITKLSETDFETQSYGECAFVPMLEGIQR